MNARLIKIYISIFLWGIFLAPLPAQESGQVLSTSRATASLYSEAPLENIEASTSSVRAAMNTETGELIFVVPIKSFKFEKAKMQEHFNDHYMESEKYPEARFEGNIINWKGKHSSKTRVKVKGKLTIHGITREVTQDAELDPDGNGLMGKSTFSVKLEDYNIKIPRMVIKNIAELVEISISAKFEPQNR